MSKRIIKIFALILSFCLLFEQSGFAQVAGQLDLSAKFAGLTQALKPAETFRPLHLRYLSYNNQNNSFKLLLDKGSLENDKPQAAISKEKIQDETRLLLKYFLIGVSLPNEAFWVNLRPDSPESIIDKDLAKTDVGKIFLETDLKLKKDTALATSPSTREGKKYWEELYKKANELFGNENITIPTLTRPWIVADEIIIRVSPEGAYIYKATLKVMLEADYLASNRSAIANSDYQFKDPRLKELNQYSSRLIKELIVPNLNKKINTSKEYAPLRQVYYSLILAQWFKKNHYGKGGVYSWRINKGQLNGLTSDQPADIQSYFKQYQSSFKDGEYNQQEQVKTLRGQAVRSYFSGGIELGAGVGAAATAGEVSASQVSPLPQSGHTLGARVGAGGEVTLEDLAVSPAADLPPEVEELASEIRKDIPEFSLEINAADEPRISHGGTGKGSCLTYAGVFQEKAKEAGLESKVIKMAVIVSTPSGEALGGHVVNLVTTASGRKLLIDLTGFSTKGLNRPGNSRFVIELTDKKDIDELERFDGRWPVHIREPLRSLRLSSEQRQAVLREWEKSVVASNDFSRRQRQSSPDPVYESVEAITIGDVSEGESSVAPGLSSAPGQVSTGNLDHFGALADAVVDAFRAGQLALPVSVSAQGVVNFTQGPVTINGVTINIVIDNTLNSPAMVSEDGATITINQDRINQALQGKNLTSEELLAAAQRILIHEITEAYAIQNKHSPADAHIAAMMAEAMHPDQNQNIRDALAPILLSRDQRQARELKDGLGLRGGKDRMNHGFSQKRFLSFM